MLKKRVIPIQLLVDDRLVKTQNFLNPRDVGDPVMSSKVYSDQDADELILLSIDNVNTPFEKLATTVEQIAKKCFVPLSVGGGITSIDEAKRLFAAGADKIIINSAIYNNPSIVYDIASFAGSQAVTVCIDARKSDESYVLYSNGGRIAQPVSLQEHISQIVTLGCGEIIAQSIDNDGLMQGYDINFLKQVTEKSSVPVVAAGGAGVFSHMYDAFKVGVSAVSCGSLFNFGDNNPLRAKAFLSNLGIQLKRI